MKKIRIAQIGTSTYSHGNDIFNTLKKLNNVFEIVGFALPENEREKFPERMPDFEGYREMTVDEILSDDTIDAVFVETEEIYLSKYASLVAKSGKHTHMEKPGGICLADFENLINIVKEKNTVFHLGYMYRYNPYVISLLDDIKNGVLGEIISVEAQMNCCHPKVVREWLGTFRGGIMFFLGCHLIDLILQIQGSPENIIKLNKSTSLDDVTSTDFGMAVFEYKNGNSFVKINSTEVGGYARRQFVVSGSKKTVELKPFEMFAPEGQYNIFTEKTEYTSAEWRDRGLHSIGKPIGRYDDMLIAFAKMVNGEIKNTYTPEYELMLYKTILKCCGKQNV